MAGMDHLRSTLIRAAGVAAEETVLFLEHLEGHDAHSVEHSGVARVAAEAAVGADIDPYLVTLLAALDARYAAGATPGPLMNRAEAAGILSSVGRAAANQTTYRHEEQHGRYSRAPQQGVFAQNAFDAAFGGLVLEASIDAWFTDLDARYAAGATATAPGVVMAGMFAACHLACLRGAGWAITTMEEACAGHDGHSVAHGNEVVAAALAQLDVTLSAALGFLLQQWDARYQVHA